MTELINHIKAENTKRQAWVDEDPENRFAGMVTYDLDHWARMDVYTVEDYKRYMIIGDISDLYKDVHGVRPRFMNLNDMTLEELERVMDGLESDAVDAFKREEDREVVAIKEFEKTVAKVQGYCSCDRRTAINYLMDAEDVGSDEEYFEYKNGIPYGYIRREVV